MNPSKKNTQSTKLFLQPRKTIHKSRITGEKNLDQNKQKKTQSNGDDSRKAHRQELYFLHKRF